MGQGPVRPSGAQRQRGPAEAQAGEEARGGPEGWLTAVTIAAPSYKYFLLQGPLSFRAGGHCLVLYM